jgi:hypothetical protein
METRVESDGRLAKKSDSIGQVFERASKSVRLLNMHGGSLAIRGNSCHRLLLANKTISHFPWMFSKATHLALRARVKRADATDGPAAVAA